MMKKQIRQAVFWGSWFFVVSIFIVLPADSYALDDKPAAKEQIEEANDLAKKLAQEIKVVQEAQKDVAEEHYKKGVRFYRDKEYLMAIEEFKLALKIFPGYKNAEGYVSRCQSKQSKADEKFAQELIERRKGKVAALLEQGLKYSQKGELQKSLAKIKQALELDPANEPALYYERYISKNIKKKRELWAKIETRKQDRKAKTDARNLLASGLGYYSRGLYDEAINQWEKVLPLTAPSDYTRRQAEMLISEAKGDIFETRDTKAGLMKEVERRSALLEADRQWVLPQYLQVRAKEIEEEDVKQEPEAKRKLTEQARQVVSLDFDDAHLREVLTYLSMVSGINIVLDETVFPDEEDVLDQEIDIEEEPVQPEETEEELDIEDIVVEGEDEEAGAEE
ncbi:MAG: hypothetical protein KAV18_04945, partial [Candidatus Omnitrophica bacterium]|nr:hypothetical protein [Candidatus Omnitrophota bacterium]